MNILFSRSLLIVFLLLLLLISRSPTSSSAVLTKEQSWTLVLMVPAGQGNYTRSGMPDASRIQVTGNISILSCCGYSTNDVEFSLSTTHYPSGHNFGVVSGLFAFEWNITQDIEYQLTFDNRWLVCTPTICQPDPSSSSYHNKTVTVSVTEIGEIRSIGIPIVPFLIVAGIGAILGSVSFVIVLTRKRRQPWQSSTERGTLHRDSMHRLRPPKEG